MLSQPLYLATPIISRRNGGPNPEAVDVTKTPAPAAWVIIAIAVHAIA